MTKVGKLSIIALVVASLAACGDQNENVKDIDTGNAEARTVDVTEEAIVSEAKNENKLGIGVMDGDKHWQDGFTINEIVPQTSGHFVVTGSNMYGPVFGVLDESLEWVIEPNFEIANVTTFSDGLIGVAIWDSRATRAGADEGDNEIWGFVNEDGEWTIEPTYREVSEFSEGLAFVLTIEEDRDDLANSRGIIIDKKGKEIAEVLPAKEYYQYHQIENYVVHPKFLNGTMDLYLDERSDEHQIVDKEGMIFDFPADVTDYFLNGYEVVYGVTQDSDWISNIYKTNVKSNNTTEVPVNYAGFDNSIVMLYDSEFFRRNKLFELQVGADGKTQFGLYNVDGEKVVEYNAGASDNFSLEAEGQDWVIYRNPEVKFDNPDENGYDDAITYEYINNEGKIQEFILKYDWTLAKYKDRYWESGTEYAILKTFDGETLLGEDAKIFKNEIEHIDGNKFASVKYRANSESTEQLPGFVNLETGEFMTLEQFIIEEME